MGGEGGGGETWELAGGGEEEGERGGRARDRGVSFVGCFSHLTIDHGSLSGRSGGGVERLTPLTSHPTVGVAVVGLTNNVPVRLSSSSEELRISF